MNAIINDSLGVLNVPLLAVSMTASQEPALVHCEGIKYEYEFNANLYADAGISFVNENSSIETLVSFVTKFITEQKPLDEKSSRILEENLWDLV